MTGFYELLSGYITALLLLTYAALLCVLCRMICRWFHTQKIAPLIPDAGILLFILILLSALSDYQWGITTDVSSVGPAAVCSAVLGPILIVYAAVGICRTYRCKKNELSPWSIKQATDDLPEGICFADPEGWVVLCNRRMRELAITLLGSYPQMIGELEAALQNPEKTCGVVRLAGTPALHRFPDGTVWCYQTTALSEPGLEGYTQTMAQDVTELHESNALLQSDNEKMKAVNQKLREMYACLSDWVREQETLELKMHIHDTLGESLITIAELMKDGSERDLDEQLETLQKAVGYFSSNRSLLHGTFEEVKRRAAEMKVTVCLEGYIPQNELVESLIVAAVRECVTNCVKHAGGDRVTVAVTEHSGIYTVTITNNGSVPEERIVEGGGLSALRCSVESAGGELYVSHKPAFALILNLPGKEREG